MKNKMKKETPLCFICTGIYSQYDCSKCVYVKGKENEIMFRSMLKPTDKT